MKMQDKRARLKRRAAGAEARSRPHAPQRLAQRRAGEPSVEELLAQELLSVCLAALNSYGVDAAKVLESQRSVRSLSTQAPTARKIFHDMHRLGELTTEWTENPHYVDHSGRPKVLPIDGKGASFATLVRKYFGVRRLPEILALAYRTRVLEQVGPDRVAQLNATVMSTGNPVPLLARTVLSVRWLLNVAERNGLRSSDKAQLVPERMACSVVAKEHFAEFSDLMRPQLSNLVDMGNRWLTKCTVKAGPKGIGRRARLIGVHAYVFRD